MARHMRQPGYCLALCGALILGANDGEPCPRCPRFRIGNETQRPHSTIDPAAEDGAAAARIEETREDAAGAEAVPGGGAGTLWREM